MQSFTVLNAIEVSVHIIKLLERGMSCHVESVIITVYNNVQCMQLQVYYIYQLLPTLFVVAHTLKHC